jgi:hypothetical protein
MNWIPRTRQRNSLLLAMIACVPLLLLTACGAPTPSGNGNTTGSYSTSQQTQYNQPAQVHSNSNSNPVTQPDNNSNASQVKNLDRQVQSTLQSLDNTEQNGNSINSGSDNQQMP